MKVLWRTLEGHRLAFVLIAALEVITSGAEALLHPLLLKAIFDQAILARDFGKFGTLGAIYLLLGIGLNLGAYWLSKWRKRTENSCVLSLQMELLDHALDLDGRQISKAGNASYVSRIHNDVFDGVLPAIDVTIRAAKQTLACIVLVGVLLYLSWQASLVLLLIVPPLVIVSNRIAKRIEDNTNPQREAEAQYINKLARTLESFHAIRGLSLLRPAARVTNVEALRQLLGISFTNYRLSLKQRTLSDLAMNVSDTASMVVGAYFVFAGMMTFGSFLAFVNSLWQAVTGIFEIINTIPEFRQTSAVLKRIHTLRTTRTVEYHNQGPMVVVRGARVAYSDDATVSIDDFELRAGEHVLLRGPNGCGKTTLLRIIAGTLAPDAGMVMLPPRVATLPAPVQLPPLPVGTLVANERLRETLGLTGLTDKLPSDLSSGERLKVGVAALLSERADVYVVDEPFANLDQEGKELVFRTLVERTRGHGLLIVHHGDEEIDGLFDRVVTFSAAHAHA